jgi:hypothetical protein
MRNIFTATEAGFLPIVSTENRPRDYRLPPNADSARSEKRRHRSLICISCCQSRHHQNFKLFFLHRTNGALAPSNMTDISYYIGSRCLAIQHDRGTLLSLLKYLSFAMRLLGEFNNVAFPYGLVSGWRLGFENLFLSSWWKNLLFFFCLSGVMFVGTGALA